MGVYDTIHIMCPECGELYEEQSKAADCILANYTVANAPPAILADIANERFECSNCKTEFCVVLQHMAHVIKIGY